MRPDGGDTVMPFDAIAVQFTFLWASAIDSIPTVAVPCSFWGIWMAPLGTVNPTSDVADASN